MNIIRLVSDYAIPVIILLILITGLCRNVKVYDIFVEGAKDSITTVVRIIPTLVGLFVAIGVFQSIRCNGFIGFAVRPIARLFNIPSEVIPLVLLRPVSGSASLALVSDMLKTFGPDSFYRQSSIRHSGIKRNHFLCINGILWGCRYKTYQAYPFGSINGKRSRNRGFSMDMHIDI